MPSQRLYQNKALMARSQDIKDYIREQIQRVVANVKAINEAYHAERERLTRWERARLEQEQQMMATQQSDSNNVPGSNKVDQPSYFHGGLSIQMGVLDPDDPLMFPSATIYWVRGRWKVNSNIVEDGSTKTKKITVTKKIHHCGKYRGYSKYNIKAALPKKAQWEVDLTNEVEEDLVAYRRYLIALTELHKALLRCPPMPSIAEGGRVATRLAE